MSMARGDLSRPVWGVQSRPTDLGICPMFAQKLLLLLWDRDSIIAELSVLRSRNVFDRVPFIFKTVCLSSCNV